MTATTWSIKPETFASQLTFEIFDQFLGTYTPTGSNSDTEMHVTYASPGAAQYYRKNGKFADGTVLVKETFATDHAQMTTGDAHWASKTIVWFVMIKDAKNRFNNPLRGNGWGWAIFKSDAPATTRLTTLQLATDEGDPQKRAFDSGHIQQGKTWNYVAGEKGTYNYYRTIHSFMKGKLIVE